MAVLEKIRQKGWLLVIVVGGATAAFVLGDLLSGGPSRVSNSNSIGSLNGEDFNVNQFSEYLDNVKSQYSTLPEKQQYNRAWDFLVNAKLIESAASNLGINITSEEKKELVTGSINSDNRHTYFNNFFTSNGQVEFNLLAVQNFINNLSEQRVNDKQNYFKLLEGVSKERLSQKYQSLIEKGIYTTNFEAVTILNEREQNATVRYVAIPYSLQEVEITDEEISQYYKNNISDFQNEGEIRSIEYVTFTVIPSIEDDEKIKEDMVKKSQNFVINNDCIILPYQTASDITDPKFIELITKEAGTVDPPYKLSNGSYRVVKLSEIVNRYDSVEARHILLKKENYSPDSAKTILKDLKKQIKNGADFGQLARQFDYPSSIKGGDLGWFSEGQMVPAFSDTCFTSRIGDLKIVTTDFGQHLIQITNVSNTSKKFKIVYFDKEVLASSETKDSYYSQAYDFFTSVNDKDSDTSFSSFAESNNLLVREDVNLDNMTFNISTLKNSRNIVKWMFDKNTKLGDVSNVMTCGDEYVVVSLSAILPEGDKELELVRDVISQKIKNEKRFDIISSKSSNFSSLEEASSLFNTLIDTAQSVNFSSNNINGIGSEQNFIGVVNALEIGEVSTIIQGNSSAYIISVVSKNLRKISEATEKQRLEIQNSHSGGVFYNSVLEIFKENSDIIDNRFLIY